MDSTLPCFCRNASEMWMPLPIYKSSKKCSRAEQKPGKVILHRGNEMFDKTQWLEVETRETLLKIKVPVQRFINHLDISPA